MSNLTASQLARLQALLGQYESEDVVPTRIGSMAWQVAMDIDTEVNKFLAEHGMNRSEGRNRVMEAIARMVQLTINTEFAGIRAVLEEILHA